VSPRRAELDWSPCSNREDRAIPGVSTATTPGWQGEINLAIRIERREEVSVIQLEGSIDISVAADFKQTLLDAFNGPKAIRIALASTTELDVTAIQLLWAAEREAKASSFGFSLEGSLPNSIADGLKDMGFEKFPVPA
jgi:anti-anti-sigma regulatory factor